MKKILINLNKTKHLIMFSLVAFFTFLLVSPFLLIENGLNRQTEIYLNNWNSAFEKYIDSDKYYLNIDNSDYNLVIEETLDETFIINAKKILFPLIGSFEYSSEESALEFADNEINEIISVLHDSYKQDINLYLIIKKYNEILIKVIKKYTNSVFFDSIWKANHNPKLIYNFLTSNWKNTKLYQTEIQFFLNGSKNFSFDTIYEKEIYFEGLQNYTYFSHNNYLSLISKFIGGSLNSKNQILIGNWSTNDLDYVNFLERVMLKENFYKPKLELSFFLQRLENIIFFAILPFYSFILLIIFIFGGFTWFKKDYSIFEIETNFFVFPVKKNRYKKKWKKIKKDQKHRLP